MKAKTGLVLGTTVSFLILGMAIASAQEPEVTEPTVTESTAPGIKTESDVQWVWGEVVSVDIPKNELKVKYLDYETDQEKEMDFIADDKTTYENIKSIAEIKTKDTVSIDYSVNPEGKNLAKNISVEKPEGTQPPQEETPAVGAETTPTASQ